MKKNSIKHPDIAIKLSIKAYTAAQKQYNETTKKNFAESPAKVFPKLTPEELVGKTVQAALLKDTHYQLFVELINMFHKRVNKISRFFNNPAFVSDVVKGRNMSLLTGEIGAINSRQNNTIRERLRRLEMADIIKVKFHGHKKPLEVIFNKEICLIYDRLDMNYVPKSKFLSDCDTVFLVTYDQEPQNIKGLLPNTSDNITIGESGVINNRYKNDNQGVIYDNLKDTLPKQNSSKTPIRNRGKQESDRETEKKTPGGPQLKELEVRRREAIVYYSRLFFATLREKIFPDKIFSQEYEKECLNYIANQYFAKRTANHITNFERLWTGNYKIRIEIAEKWISRFKSDDGGRFDTTFFYPKSFLDIERRGRGVLSFANTEKFLENSTKYQKINAYRKMDDEGRHKLNVIARQLENGKIDYLTALEKVKSITRDSDEYVKQLNARWFGMYKTMNL